MAKIRPSGGYRDMASFQTATIIYDATYWFCEKYLDSRSRTVDQMVQAARSGRQNIAEGSRFSATSSQTELRLYNTARASLEELLLDYEDFLRQRRLPQWEPDHPQAQAVRNVPRSYAANQYTQTKNDPSDRSDQSDQKSRLGLSALSDQERWALYARWLDHPEAAMRANALICLIHQANFLLDQQIKAAERQFIEGGGYSEQLATARLAERERQKRARYQQDRSDQTDQTDQIPACPKCGQAMALRTARQGKHEGRQFWGCTAYPDCKGMVEV